MTTSATDFDGFNIDRTCAAAIVQYASVYTSTTAGLINATSAVTHQTIGFLWEASSASGDVRSVRYAGTAIAIAQTTITPNTHQRLGPTTTATRIANVTTGIYCAMPILDEAVAAADEFPVIITLGSF